MFKLKGWAGVKWGAARRRESEKKKFPEHSRKLFSLDSFKSRHPVLEFSNHHQRNLQSEHTASQFRPAHLLTLAPAELCVLHCVCVCVCLFAVCHLRLGWLGTGPWQGWGETLWGWGDRTHAHVPTLSYTHLHAAFFFFFFAHRRTHTVKYPLYKHGNALEHTCVHK